MTHRIVTALMLGFVLSMGATLPAEAHVVRVERADRPSKPARVKYIEAVSIWRSDGWHRFKYVELFNGATFRVSHCKRPVRLDMHIDTVRRICGHH